MVTLNIKPLGVNSIYTGRRFLTPEGRQYKKSIQWLIPTQKIPEGPLMVSFRFYVSNSGADVDGPCKATLDAIAEKLGFNDNRVIRIEAEKFVVPKGQEKIEYEITPYARAVPF